jgi:cellulose synthase/poly-beta-1,6-N-acetylglucosamine synthase-like glycosyltransferase
LAVLRTLMLIVLARRHVRHPVPLSPARRARLPDVSIVVPAYNEERGKRPAFSPSLPPTIQTSTSSWSTDATAAVVAGLALPNVQLFRQHNAGKPAALDYGIRAARHDILVLIDGDTIFEPDAIGALVAAFGNPDVGAVAGHTKVGNRRGMLGRWQHIEYVMGLNLDRRMFDMLQCMPTVVRLVPSGVRYSRTSVVSAMTRWPRTPT